MTTTSPVTLLKLLKSQITALNDTALKGAVALRKLLPLLDEIETGKLYLQEATTMAEFCEKNWHWSPSYIRQVVKAIEFRQGQRLLAETSERPVEIPVSVSRANKLRKMEKEHEAPVFEKCDLLDSKSGISENNLSNQIEPERHPPATVAISHHQSMPLSQAELSRRLSEIERDLKRILSACGWELHRQVCHVLDEVQKIQHMQMELPGMVFAQVPKRKARGTLEEVQGYCASLGLPQRDADYFFYKCEGCGWLNGGRPIKDWKGVVRSWQQAGYLPSQKLNGQPKPETLADQSRRKIRQIVNEGLRGSMP